jgi:hypothetical protein
MELLKIGAIAGFIGLVSKFFLFGTMGSVMLMNASPLLLAVVIIFAAIFLMRK